MEMTSVRPTLKRRWLVMATIGALFVASCSSAGDSTPSSFTATAMDAVTTTTRPEPFGNVEVSPATVRPGSTVTLTPRVEVEHTCQDYVSVHRPNEPKAFAIAPPIAPWQFEGGPIPLTIPACRGLVSLRPVTITIAPSIQPGDLVLCITPEFVAAGCATVTVQ
ncbi:MAG: hypothetical protein AB7L13_03860 [Acidimicrobiia bacterium]